MTNPIFSELVSAIYGNAVDEREIWDVISKSGNMPKDASLKETRTGQALNVVAGTGGGLALYHATKRMNLARKGIDVEGSRKSSKLISGMKRVPGLKVIAEHPKGAAVTAAGAAMTLHGAELAGDAIAARSLHRSAQRAKYNKSQIKKSIGDVIEARKSGRITTEQAISLADDVIQKGLISEVARGAWKGLKGTKGLPSGVRQAPGAFRRLVGNAGKKVHLPVQPLNNKQLARGSAAVGAVAGAGGTLAYQNRQRKSAIPPNPTVAKSDSGMTWKGEISKVDTDKRQVFGWCSLTSMNGQPVIDLQGDYVPLEEIEKAAYEYVIHSRKGGDMHARDGEGPKHTADLIESFLVTPEKLKQMGLSDNALPHGWWIGMKVNDDEQWNLVKSGGRTGFSIHGKGSRIEKML